MGRDEAVESIEMNLHKHIKLKERTKIMGKMQTITFSVLATLKVNEKLLYCFLRLVLRCLLKFFTEVFMRFLPYFFLILKFFILCIIFPIFCRKENRYVNTTFYINIKF